MESCGNCRRTIGDLETPFIWDNSVVCCDCRQRLMQQAGNTIAPAPTANRGYGKWFIVVVACVALTAIPGWFWFHSIHSDSISAAPVTGRTPMAAAPVKVADPPGAGQKIAAMFQTKGTIRGAAWLVKKSGDSTLIRGMEVRLIRDGIVDGNVVREEFNGCLDDLRAAIARNKDHLAEEMAKQAREEPGFRSDIMAKFYRESNDKLTALLNDRQALGATIKPRESLADAYQLVKKANSYFGQPAIAGLTTPFLVASAHTDSEGRYSFQNVPSGKYFVHAEFDSAYSRVQWFQPIEITTSGDTSCDLFNDTAEVITNKATD